MTNRSDEPINTATAVGVPALYESGIESGKKQAKEMLFDIETTRFLTDVLTAAGFRHVRQAYPCPLTQSSPAP